MTHAKAKLAVAGLIVVAAVTYLAFAGIRKGWVYYVDVDQLITSTEYRDQHVRVCGRVAEEGFDAAVGRLNARFTLLGKERKLAVSYQGMVPDLFKVGGGRGARRPAYLRRHLRSQSADDQMRQQVPGGRARQAPGGQALTSEIGHFSLVTALLASGGAVVASVAAVRFNSANALRVARGLLVLFTGLMVAAGAALVLAFVDDDLRLKYVAAYSERALPGVYKVTAFWAGQQGSLLLWALLLALMTGVYLYQNRRSETGHGAGLAGLAVLGTFFAALLLYAADPFALSRVVPADGDGLNPMLQNFGMIAHPPVLFAGYAALTFPFVLMLEALATGRTDDQWVSAARPWVIVAWLFLSAGIVLGAQWAYVELGWGGYWAWDPVENASLLPWLTSTALLHSMMVQRQRRMLRFWTAGLTAASFILCIFGTYLTRSGVIQSVHAFPESSIGQFFLILLAVLVLVSTGLILGRWNLLKSPQKVEAFLSKEGLFLATNVLLVLMTATVLVGTIFPILSQAVSSACGWLASELGTSNQILMKVAAWPPITVKPAFYNTIVAPMGLILLTLMAVGPMLGYGKESATRLPRRMLLPGIVAAVAAVGAFANMYRTNVWQMHPIRFHWEDSGLIVDLTNVWALACVAIIAFAVAAIMEDLIRATLLRARDQGESTPLALVRLFDRGHRRYGGQFVHVGMLMILAGVAGSSLFGLKHTIQVTPGHQTAVEGYTLRLDSLGEVRHGNYTAIEAAIVLTDSAGRSRNFNPEVRFYDKSEQPNHEVSLSTTLTPRHLHDPGRLGRSKPDDGHVRGVG